MTTQHIIALVAVVLVAGGGAWYFTQNSETAETESATTGTGSTEGTTQNASDSLLDSFTGVGSFTDLLARGDSFRCDFEAAESGNVSKGTVFFDGKGERFTATGEYQNEFDSGTFGIITTSETSYIWGETPDGKQGIKVTVPEGESFDGHANLEADFGSGSHTASPVGMDDNVSYDCDPWRVDASMFVPPSDVVFMDMEEMFEEMLQGLPEGFEMPDGSSQMVQ